MSTGRARSYNNDDADCSQFVDPEILKILPDAVVLIQIRPTPPPGEMRPLGLRLRPGALRVNIGNDVAIARPPGDAAHHNPCLAFGPRIQTLGISVLFVVAGQCTITPSSVHKPVFPGGTPLSEWF